MGVNGLDITIGVLIYTPFQAWVARVKRGGAAREKGGHFSLLPFLHMQTTSFQCVCVLEKTVNNSGLQRG